MKKALITGITGQDGSYLAELLLSKEYEVHGVIRRASTFGTDRIDHLYLDPHVDTARLFLHYGDLSDGNSLSRLLLDIQPDEVYNLGAQSHVAVSYQNPIYSVDVDPQGGVDVKMTLTSPACPVAGTLPGEVEMKVRGVDGVTAARVELVWDPPWDKDMMSEAAQLKLGFF